METADIYEAFTGIYGGKDPYHGNPELLETTAKWVAEGYKHLTPALLEKARDEYTLLMGRNYEYNIGHGLYSETLHEAIHDHFMSTARVGHGAKILKIMNKAVA
ncbi:hypothetical protein [Pseudoxanthomonas winnipegensis]|uniref:Uncharacterized protein n=1 Tax=Pseudoxanthomonas winnipegensis TaxID=2480810 RepID=A0A4Q8M5A2_9GAMM|nr:hypothetical protein [Pseudoxanthomonas winnipegensis]TAA41579.1 hypothetical protein EA655_11605 [Pseudoxanthomonas winnipegensis]